MRVLKFGGTSVANSERFMRVADIIENNARQGQVATVLSAPAKITNHLVAMIEKTVAGQDVITNMLDAQQIFADLLQGLSVDQPGFDYSRLKSFVEQEFAYLKHVLHGISLLGQCPDSVNAAIISRGEKLSIAIMESVFQARGYGVTVINPVAMLLAHGHYLESTVDIAESTRRLIELDIPKDHVILMAGFTAGNDKGELVVLGRNGSDYSAAVLAACLPEFPARARLASSPRKWGRKHPARGAHGLMVRSYCAILLASMRIVATFRQNTCTPIHHQLQPPRAQVCPERSAKPAAAVGAVRH